MILVGASATAEQEVVGSIPGSDKVLLGFFIKKILSNSRGVWIYALLMAIGSPSITRDLNQNWRNVGVLSVTPLPNP